MATKFTYGDCLSRRVHMLPLSSARTSKLTAQLAYRKCALLRVE